MRRRTVLVSHSVGRLRQQSSQQSSCIWGVGVQCAHLLPRGAADSGMFFFPLKTGYEKTRGLLKLLSLRVHDGQPWQHFPRVSWQCCADRLPGPARRAQRGWRDSSRRLCTVSAAIRPVWTCHTLMSVTCSREAQPTRFVGISSCRTASMMASLAMSTPRSLQYSAARLAADFTSSGAGCQSGGPCVPNSKVSAAPVSILRHFLCRGSLTAVAAECRSVGPSSRW